MADGQRSMIHVAWPTEKFWNDLRTILQRERPLQLDRMMTLLFVSNPLSDGLQRELVDMIWNGWSRVQSFVQSHPPPHPRCAVDIMIAHIAASLVAKLVPRAERRSYTPTALSVRALAPRSKALCAKTLFTNMNTNVQKYTSYRRPTCPPPPRLQPTDS